MPESLGALYVAALLLPGFVGYLVLSRIYDRKIDDSFDKLGLVVLISAASLPIFTIFRPIILPDSSTELTGIILQKLFLYLIPIQTGVCILLGLIFGLIGNSEWFSTLLNNLGASSKAGHAAVIAATIRKHPSSFFRLRLKNGGYILGHPVLYSLDGEECCMFLEKAAFRRKRPDRRHNVPPQIPVNGAGVLMVNFDEVLFIEVL